MSGDRAAVDVVLDVLRRPPDAQPVEIHRAAVTALGRLRDPRVVEDLLAVMYRVPDSPTSRNLAERAKVALCSIGEPAVSPTLRMLENDDEQVEALAAEHGLDRAYVTFVAAQILGDLGSPSAVEPLARSFRDADNAATRAVTAQALGRIGDARATSALCNRAAISHDPLDAFPIAEALGRIGGSAAVDCLLRTVAKGRFDADLVASPEFVHEIRWEAGRFTVMAAGPSDAKRVRAAFARSRESAVVEKLREWDVGLDVLETCGENRACYRTALADSAAPWFQREVAATQLARLAPGDEDVAVAISQAFAVPNPDARVTMAHLPALMLRGRRCGACAAILERQISADVGKLDAIYQLSVLTARYTEGQLGEHGEPFW